MYKIELTTPTHTYTVIIRDGTKCGLGWYISNTGGLLLRSGFDSLLAAAADALHILPKLDMF